MPYGTTPRHTTQRKAAGSIDSSYSLLRLEEIHSYNMSGRIGTLPKSVPPMHNCAICAAIFSFLLLAPQTSPAMDETGNYMTRGIGAKDGSCGDYTTTEIMRKYWYQHWLFGYLSGVNQYRQGKADFTNEAAPAGLTQWVEAYCKENPLAPFSKAADALLHELQKSR